jgi:multiple sugar transport system substrate-binding protein
MKKEYKLAKLRKRVHMAFGLTTAAALLVGLTACASGTPSSGASEAKQEDITLVIGNPQFLDAKRGEGLWNAVKEYEKKNGHVTLEQTAIASGEFNDKIATQVGAGQGPDVIIGQDGLFHTLANANLLVPLDDAIKGIDGLNDTNDAGVVDGKQLGVAWQRAAYALVYNKTLLEKAGAAVPTTVDELIVSAKQVTKETGAVGFATRHQMAEFNNWHMDFSNWLHGYGGGAAKKNGDFAVNSSENVKAVADYKKMYDSGILPLGDDMSTMRTRFKEGDVGFILDNSGGTLNMALGGTLASTEIGAAAMPFKFPGSHQQILVSVNANSKHQEVAKDFVTWLMGKEGQAALRKVSGPDLIATDLPMSAEFQTANPWGSAFEELGPKSRATLATGHEADSPQIMRIVMTAVERVISSGADPKKELDAAQKEIDALGLD